MSNVVTCFLYLYYTELFHIIKYCRPFHILEDDAMSHMLLGKETNHTGEHNLYLNHK